MTMTAAETIRDARRKARLTQVELGERANVNQSVVSAYEAGRREPGVEMLRKLVRAAGFELRFELSALRRSPLQRRVDRNRTELLAALHSLGASNVRLFGSVARGDDGPNSDIDLLVDVDDSVGLFGLGRMRSTAESVLGVTVDIVPANSLKPDAAKRVLDEAVSV